METDTTKDWTQGPAEKRYEQLRSTRDLFLDRARRACRLTLPYLVPASNDPDKTYNEEYPLPWNGIGAEGHNSLAGRLLMALMPVTETFFRYTLDEKEKQAWMAEGEQAGQTPEEIAKKLTEYERALVAMEQGVLRDINSSSDRTVFHEGLLHLIGPGNILLYIDEEDGLKAFHLTRYVCKRDGMGRPLDAVVCESFTKDSLPQKVRESLGLDHDEKDKSPDPLEQAKVIDEEEIIHVYTHIEWDYPKENVCWYQECRGELIEGSEIEVSLEQNPWLPLRMVRIDGEDYGIGYIESRCLADLQTADSLSQAVIEGSLIAAQCKHVVRPGGSTSIKDLVKAKNGGYVVGNPDDVKMLRADKGMDLQVAQQALNQVEARLAKALLTPAVRDSERTTAEEIRMLALQIENGLGAIYSILTVEFQVPYISRKLYLMNKTSKLPEMPEGLVKPVVSVGLAAVGRSNDLEKLMRFNQSLQMLGDVVGQEEIADRIDVSSHIKRLANGFGLETLDLVLSEEKVAELRQARQQTAMQQQALTSPMADPQKLATAAATAQQMQEPPPDQGGEPAV